MKRKITLFFMLSTIMVCYSQSSINSSGGIIKSGSTEIFSYSLGQIVATTNSDIFLQGVQISKEELTVGKDEEIIISNKSIVYPNPVISQATLIIPTLGTNKSYRLFTAQGRLLLQEKITEKATSIPMENLSEGIYFLQVIDNNKKLKTFRIIKR